MFIYFHLPRFLPMFIGSLQWLDHKACWFQRQMKETIFIAAASLPTVYSNLLQPHTLSLSQGGVHWTHRSLSDAEEGVWRHIGSSSNCCLFLVWKGLVFLLLHPQFSKVSLLEQGLGEAILQRIKLILMPLFVPTICLGLVNSRLRELLVARTAVVCHWPYTVVNKMCCTLTQQKSF